MRRGLFSDRQRCLLGKVEREYEEFRSNMLSMSSEEVYCHCSEIKFYECVFEFFSFCEEIDRECMEACLGEQDVIATLWGIYNRYEYLRADSWEDVKELLRVLALRKGVKEPEQG